MKRKLAVMVPAVMTVTSMPVFAESAGSANSDVVNSLTTVANDMVATGNAVVPVALTVVGIALVVVFGIRIFRRIAK